MVNALQLTSNLPGLDGLAVQKMLICASALRKSSMYRSNQSASPLPSRMRAMAAKLLGSAKS